MYEALSVSLLNLVLSLSDALDLASPELSQHQLRTAYVAWELGRVAALPRGDLEDVFIAALLHDVGALSLEEKIDVHRTEEMDPEPHCLMGEALLKAVPVLAPCARIVRFHHRKWQDWQMPIDTSIVLHSQILLVADYLERAIDRRRYILHQNEDIIARIRSLSETLVHRDVVEMVRMVSKREDFWLDLVSPRLYSLLLHFGPGRRVDLDLDQLRVISVLFRSRFTATHSSGVAACASALSRLFGLTEMEIGLMEITGNLHDLGKLAIPNSILDKPGKLTKEEFALMQQHTYFTYQVLTTVGGIRNIAEWAAFHHEKLDGTGYPFHMDAKRLDVNSRILAVADMFTALAEDRPYRKGMKKDDVLSILRAARDKNSLDARAIGVLEKNYEEIAALTAQKQAESKEYYEREFARRTEVNPENQDGSRPDRASTNHRMAS
jgi:HD-GYP domain-containing protein (c-di-GMP phosphodiesterase class II)